MDTYQPHSLRDQVRQSPPIELSVPYDTQWLNGKTMLITGGASGFGAAFLKQWAASGANVIIGDVNVQKAENLLREVRKETGNPNIYFVYCDVADWQSQVNFCKEAVKLSPTGGIDTVVANAGIAQIETLERPENLNTAAPKKPDFSIIDINVTGVLYTVHLAMFWLPRNPNSKPASLSSHPSTVPRDRHILLLGSVASLMPLPGCPLYVASKHAVLGLFRSLRCSSFVEGVRVNMLCPYFIDTPIVPTIGRVLLAGSGMGKVPDVVDAATRMAADTRIAGRSLLIGPKVNVKQRQDGEIVLVGEGETGGEERAVWEAFAEDFEDAEIMTRRVVRLLNAVTVARGWAGWFEDMIKGFRFALRPYVGRLAG